MSATTGQSESAKLVLRRDQEDSRLSWRRRQILSSANLSLPKVVLEIGAFDNPTVRTRDGVGVRYADYFSSDELRRNHAGNPKRDLSRIVEVDYVVKGPYLSRFIREQVDLVVANHVIEHLCDPIGWLCDIATFCSPDAAVFMAVPDQRFTFDYFKQPTDIGDIVRAHEEGKAQPDAYDVARMRHLHTRVDAAALWDGVLSPERPGDERPPYRKILEKARLEVERGYTDVHCTYYTADSFMQLFTELYRSQYIPWQSVLLGGVERGGNEFYVLLQKA
jgi:hypothetical protein